MVHCKKCLSSLVALWNVRSQSSPGHFLFWIWSITEYSWPNYLVLTMCKLNAINLHNPIKSHLMFPCENGWNSFLKTPRVWLPRRWPMMHGYSKESHVCGRHMLDTTNSMLYQSRVSNEKGKKSLVLDVSPLKMSLILHVKHFGDVTRMHIKVRKNFI